MTAGCHGASGRQLGIAFACVIGAAIASVLGGLFIIVVPVKNNLFLAASLAFAAGVMLYISLVDIYAGKAVGHFVEAGYSESHAFTYATICFFCGFPISWILDKIAERLAYHGPAHHMPAPTSTTSVKAQADDPNSSGIMGLSSSSIGVDVESGSDSCLQHPSTVITTEQSAVKEVQSRKLVHLGILAAMAVALHNMPEGLVTFVGYMDSVTSGITTAVAIAIHNIPEGMVIASAVYFGTGLRWRAILWATLAALTEPLGGVIGLAIVCGGSMTETVFGILFGLVGGIMAYISLKELLPSARDFDPDDRVTTGFLTAGMIIIACSLVAITFSTPSEVVAEVVNAVTAASPVAPLPPSSSLPPARPAAIP